MFRPKWRKQLFFHEIWDKKDPIKKLKNDLKNTGLASEEELKNIEKEIDLEVNDAVEFALNAPEPNPEELTKYIWAEDVWIFWP